MKALLNAAQKNCKLDDYYYRREEMEKFSAEDDDIFELASFDGIEYRVSLYHAELNVVLTEFGHYAVEVTTRKGKKYFVEL